MSCSGHTQTLQLEQHVLENDMKKILIIMMLLIPAVTLNAAELFAEVLGSFIQSSSEASTQNARVQVAYEVKRDAEGYLAGSEMTRALRLKLEQLHSDNPDLESDELVERALDEADTFLAAAQKDRAAE